MSLCRLIVITSLFLATASIEGQEAAHRSIRYSREIRPLLAKNCFACHGPDAEAREADLRLDGFETATADLGGKRPIVPTKPLESEVIRRITSSDPDLVMPPPQSGPPLSTTQIDLLKSWIEQGATYQQHWAFVPPRRTVPPDLTRQPTVSLWKANCEIDTWIHEALEPIQLTPSPMADRETLVRRLYLDLVGMPPDPEELDRFVNDHRPDAISRLIDRLLASEQYGERWSRPWLDLARYADTNGYEKDRPRSIWAYRDWVIQALNQDMPFDQFSIEQLAGDMLPEATPAQKIATGFQRNTMLNEEGGIDPLEFRYYAMVDRIATTGTIWMGMTIGCAQCHSHKFDPISHTEYYQLFALLNNADEPDLVIEEEAITKRRAEIQHQIDQAQFQLAEKFPPLEGTEPEAERRQRNLEQSFERWMEATRGQVATWHTLRPARWKTNSPTLEVREDLSIFSSGDITKRDEFQLSFPLDAQLPSNYRIAAIRIEALPDPSLPAGGPGRCYYEGRRGDFFLSELAAKRAGESLAFKSASQDYGKLSIGSGKSEPRHVYDGDGSTGWSTAGREGTASKLIVVLEEPLAATGDLDIEMLFERHFAASLGRFRISVTDNPNVLAHEFSLDVERLLTQPAQTWNASERHQVLQAFLLETPELAEARKPLDALRAKLPDWPTTLVMQERPQTNPRQNVRYHRGEYLNPREAVEPGLPQLFQNHQQANVRDRLGFARWLVSPDNPLVARVAVNRAWQTLFGNGLVATPGDFGTQAPSPSHQELLDNLAVDWMAKGWSQKQLIRQLARSATYQQSSALSPETFAKDPNNIWLSRAPRIRLDAELVRDAFLKTSGQLTQKLGGPSVRPPQPSAVTELAYGNDAWKADVGANRYRRSLYTFSKRTAPFAAFATFDAPSGELCTAKRDRSNTPLQALTLLNDAMVMELALAFSDRSLSAEVDPVARIQWMFRHCFGRQANQAEVNELLKFIREQKLRLENQEIDLRETLKSKEIQAERGAWFLAARVLFNLDEMVTRP